MGQQTGDGVALMTATDFHLVTDWALAAPAGAVWEALTKPEDWPDWWPAVERVELVEPGDGDGVGGSLIPSFFLK